MSTGGIRYEELKNSLKICKHQPHPPPLTIHSKTSFILHPRFTALFQLEQYVIKCINIFALRLTCNFSGAITFSIFPLFHPQKSLFQEPTQYLELFMPLRDVINLAMMMPSSKLKQYFKLVDLNPDYAPGIPDTEFFLVRIFLYSD